MGLLAIRFRFTHHRQKARTASRCWFIVTGPIVRSSLCADFCLTGFSRQAQNESAMISPATFQPQASMRRFSRFSTLQMYMPSRPNARRSAM
ncbi:MAG: hypothetical protein NTU53_17820 [Planctomycetota bacterium]|nr:hypothetical protein [Planctomycetota bacterium]